MNTISSSRQFVVVFFESNMDEPTVVNNLSLDVIINGEEGFEYLYAIREKIDFVLDLEPFEWLNMSFNRDDKNCRGFIKRLK